METLTTTTKTNIEEENTTSNTNKSSGTQNKGHICLFIRDVTSSSIKKHNNTDIFMTKKGIVYQRVRLNGITVSQCNEKKNIWLDDGTDTIRVILSQRLLARVDAPKLITSASVTVFGLVKHLNNEFVIQCGGFHVESDVSNELYFHIKVIANQPLSPPPSAVMDTTTTTNSNSNSNNSNTTNTTNNKGNDVDDNKENIIHPQKPAVLFHTLSSQPSPPLKHTMEMDITTPEKKNSASMHRTTKISTPFQFAWSPEQPIATSTPLNKGFASIRNSPLKLPVNHTDQSLIYDDDDSFGDINLSFTRIETEAIQSKPQKRRWEA